MRIIPLMSGSSGNATYIESGDARILVDAGTTGKRVEGLLAQVGADMRAMDAIVVTHEHIDHVAALGVLARRYKLPVYIEPGSFDALPYSVGNFPEGTVRFFRPGERFTVRDTMVTPFSVPHDSARCVGFLFDDGKEKTALMTDIGEADDTILSVVSGSDTVLIEANHDVEMLLSGDYPYELKCRILSRYGHLSNDDCACAIAKLAQSGTKHFILGHLSQDNNAPELALVTVKAALRKAGLADGVTVVAAKRYDPTVTEEKQ